MVRPNVTVYNEKRCRVTITTSIQADSLTDSVLGFVQRSSCLERDVAEATLQECH
jgi:hypothetical protein